MAATLEEYRDILIADTYVDLARLKMRAQVGLAARLVRPHCCIFVAETTS
jgi:hypothetical protein